MRFFERFLKKRTLLLTRKNLQSNYRRGMTPAGVAVEKSIKKCHSDQDQRYLARKKAETPSKSCGPVFG